MISSALMKNSIFTSITPENRQVLIEHMVYYSLKSNETVFEEGKPGLNFFIIASGKCKVIIGG